MVYHWSGGARAGDKAESLESAEIRAVSWPDFCAGADNDHARGDIEAVTYDEEVRARNPPALCLARARAPCWAAAAWSPAWTSPATRATGSTR